MDGEALEEWIACDTVGVLEEDMARRKNGFRAWGFQPPQDSECWIIPLIVADILPFAVELPSCERCMSTNGAVMSRRGSSALISLQQIRTWHRLPNRGLIVIQILQIGLFRELCLAQSTVGVQRYIVLYDGVVSYIFR